MKPCKQLWYLWYVLRWTLTTMKTSKNPTIDLRQGRTDLALLASNCHTSTLAFLGNGLWLMLSQLRTDPNSILHKSREVCAIDRRRLLPSGGSPISIRSPDENPLRSFMMGGNRNKGRERQKTKRHFGWCCRSSAGAGCCCRE
ncbi:uncharacterized protein LOC134216970 [Armigeres subalbatus]|uniref:uncharacterized protein LOC134216970 n=1 Tax=Armigeres subalbatus TaxID=124917 RepID=UPI002ED0ED80